MYIMSLVHISFISLCLLTTPSNYPFPQPWLWQPLNLISFSMVCFCFRFHKQVRSYRICLSLSNFTKVPLESIHTISRLVKDSACNVRELGSIPGLGRSPGEGKGFPLQYSGLENSMDCIVHGVAKSQTRLSDFQYHKQQTFIFLWVSSFPLYVSIHPLMDT